MWTGLCSIGLQFLVCQTGDIQHWNVTKNIYFSVAPSQGIDYILQLSHLRLEHTFNVEFVEGSCSHSLKSYFKIMEQGVDQTICMALGQTRDI